MRAEIRKQQAGSDFIMVSVNSYLDKSSVVSVIIIGQLA
jgi:hypothetical protein